MDGSEMKTETENKIHKQREGAERGCAGRYEKESFLELG